MIRFEKELEIVLIVSEKECLEKIVSFLKSNKTPSDVLWLKDANQAMDFINSTNSYEGKMSSSTPKLFVMDSTFGLEMCLKTFEAFQHSPRMKNSHFAVLAKKLCPEGHHSLTSLGIDLIDESFMIEIGQTQLAASKELFEY